MPRGEPSRLWQHSRRATALASYTTTTILSSEGNRSLFLPTLLYLQGAPPCDPTSSTLLALSLPLSFFLSLSSLLHPDFPSLSLFHLLRSAHEFLTTMTQQKQQHPSA